MNYNCDKAEIPAALRELAEWCVANGGVPDRMVEPATDLLEVWSQELLDELGDPNEESDEFDAQAEAHTTPFPGRNGDDSRNPSS